MKPLDWKAILDLANKNIEYSDDGKLGVCRIGTTFSIAGDFKIPAEIESGIREDAAKFGMSIEQRRHDIVATLSL